MRTLGAIALLLLLAAGVWVNSLRPAPHVKARDALGKLETIDQVVHGNEKLSQFYTHGKGPLVILVASAGREASDFNELSNHLGKVGYQTIAIEPHGLNGFELLKNPNLDRMTYPVSHLLARTGNESSVLIGHAYGNRVVRMASHQITEKGIRNVKGIILLAAGGQVPSDPEADAALKRVFNPLKSYKSRMKDVRMAFFAAGNDIPDHWKRGWHTKTAIAQGKAKGDGDDSWHCARGVPMLIVQPMQDRIAPPANAYALRDKCPQEVEIVEVENAGHALLPEQPEAVANAVLAFLANHHPTEQNN